MGTEEVVVVPSANNAMVQGTVEDASGQPSSNCKLFMYRRSDGTLLGSAVSNDSGNYELTHQGENGELVFIVCLDNDDSTIFEGLVRDRITLAVESDTTSKVATHEFIFRTYSPVTISASVNGSDFAEISTFSEISASSKTTDFGTQMTVSMNTSDDMLVRLLISPSACLFVDPLQELDEVNQSNQSYTLYDANGNVIDPTLEANKTYNSSYIDDSSTDQDYVVLFGAVEFRLTNDVVEEECDCTSSTYVQPVSFSGVSGSKIVAEVSINGLSPTSGILITYDGSMDNLVATVLALVLSDGRSISEVINLTYNADDQTFTTANKTAYCLHDIMLSLIIFDASGNKLIGTTDFIPENTSLCAI